MLKPASARMGVNLAIVLASHNKSLTPTPTTLLAQLCSSIFIPLKPETGGRLLENTELLVNYIVSTSEGMYQESSGRKNYSESNHDNYMDNYVSDLANIVTNHIQYARSTVYPKAQRLLESVQQTVSSTPLKNAEDFFNLSFYKLPEVFESALVEQEVLGVDTRSLEPDIINFNQELDGFDLFAYIKTGDADQDALISAWIDASDAAALTHYVTSCTVSIEYSLALTKRLDYAMINFLFYRSLAIKQDLARGLGVVRLLTKAANNRDYYASIIKTGIDQYNTFIKQGLILTTDTEVGFSYLAEKQFNVTIYEKSFEKASEQGATLEQVFGYLAASYSSSLTASMLKQNAQEYERTWSTVRGLYVAHVSANKDSVIRMAFKLKLAEILCESVSEEDQEFYAANPGYREKTLALANAFVEQASASELECPEAVSLVLVAKIAYRHSNAYQLLKGMLDMVAQDEKVTMQDAALYTQVHYLTDFMLEQAVITR